MLDSGTIPLFIKLFCSFLAAFPAMTIWSKSRNVAWIFMALGSVFFFVDALFSTLVAIGVASYALPWLIDFPLLESLLTAIPFLFMAMGFATFVIKSNRY